MKVDLTRNEIITEDITDLQREYLGGIGVNTKLVHDLVPQGADPLGPDNVLVFGAGSLAGSLLPTANRTDVSAKSPLSGLFGSANAGGEWGVRLKYAGYDHVAFLGRAEKPVMLVIDNGRAEIRDASHLWGKDSWFAVQWVHDNLGHDFYVAGIGQGGEKMVRYACIQNGFYAAWGRTGLGAVMGSKNLKAVVVRGTGGRGKPHDPGAFKELYQEGFARVKADDSYEPFKKYGSMLACDAYNNLGGLPGRNFTMGTIPGWNATRGRKFYAEKYKVGDVACFSCPIACAHKSVVPDGPFAGYSTKSLEVTFTMEFGGKLDMADIPEILKCVELCNRYSLDVVSVAGSIAFLIEAYQKGLVNEDQIGFPVAWGDYASISRLIEYIAFRKGIGDLLAEGVKRASQHIPGSEGLAMHIKGIEIPAKDPRSKWDVWCLGFLTDTRGGDSLRTRSPAEHIPGKVLDHQREALEVTPEFLSKLDMPAGLKKEIFGDPPGYVDIARMAKYSEDLITILNSVGMCIRPPVLRSLGPDFFARALKAVNGTEYTESEIVEKASAVWDLQHRFNRREGEVFKDSAFPDRFYTESIPGRGSTLPPLSREKIQETLARYYEARGWESEIE
jgi:aldehyde:ferredoxin oxidoreductase